MCTQLGARFKQIRKAAGFTQSQTAKYLGVDQSYIAKFEKDERQFSLDLLTRAVTLFGCPLETLVNAESDVSPLPVAMRATDVRTEDLEAIATLNKLALNLQYMQSLLESGK